MKNMIRNVGVGILLIVFAIAYYIDQLGFGAVAFFMQWLSLGVASFLMFYNPQDSSFFKKWNLGKMATIVICCVFGLGAFIAAGLYSCLPDRPSVMRTR